MKLFISADLEGISGVVSTAHTSMEGNGYAQARKLMVGEVNAAIEGAFEGGATKICVNDSHGSMRNLLIEDLHPDAVLVTGSPKPLVMMQGIDSSFDLVGFVGYHARRDSMTAVLEHTISGAVVRGITLNKMPMGEFEINTALAGYFDVPVGFLSGDNVIAQQARELIPNIKTAEVKVAQTRTSAKCLHPLKAQELIKQTMKQAVQMGPQFKPYKIDSPVFEIEFINTGMAELASLLPSAERISATRLRMAHPDLLKAWNGIYAMIALARSTLAA